MNTYTYLFGPVPSRRFGRSLGIDLVPLKTCSEDCIFCQLGPTAQPLTERREYAPTEEVLRELDHWLASGQDADCLTLSGSGEPTLHIRFGDVLQHIRSATDLPAVLLTNGTLFHLPEVRQGAMAASIVKLSLSAWDQASFERINRPHSTVLFDTFIEGLYAFRKEFDGAIWLEVMLVEGVNSDPGDVRKIAALARDLRPDRIHLNTVARPPAEISAKPVSANELSQLAQLFTPEGEVIASFSSPQPSTPDVTGEELIAILQRHPSTIDQLAEVTGAKVEDISQRMDELQKHGLATEENRNGDLYYRS